MFAASAKRLPSTRGRRPWREQEPCRCANSPGSAEVGAPKALARGSVESRSHGWLTAARQEAPGHFSAGFRSTIGASECSPFDRSAAKRLRRRRRECRATERRTVGGLQHHCRSVAVSDAGSDAASAPRPCEAAARRPLVLARRMQRVGSSQRSSRPARSPAWIRPVRFGSCHEFPRAFAHLRGSILQLSCFPDARWVWPATYSLESSGSSGLRTPSAPRFSTWT